jgi:hypothetical protein
MKAKKHLNSGWMRSLFLSILMLLLVNVFEANAQIPAGDSDSDGIPNSVEWGTNTNKPADDYDKDGTPNYLDTDSDNDGILDSVEAGSNPSSPADLDGDGNLDYLQSNLGCQDLEQIALVDAIPGLTENNVLTFSSQGYPNGITTPLALSAAPAKNVPQYAIYDIGGGNYVPVTIFTWRISSKRLLNGKGFNNFFVEGSRDCQGFNSNYKVKLLAFKGPKGDKLTDWNESSTYRI